MQLIERVELTSSQASITFSNIPQDGTDLLILTSTRVTGTFGDAGVGLEIEFNDTTTNFSGRSLYGMGSGSGASYAPARLGGAVNAGQTTSSTFANTAIYIPNYTSGNNKSYSYDSVVENNATASFQEIYAGLWSNTAAINKIELYKAGTDLASGSSATLYKITKGSDGTTTVA